MDKWASYLDSLKPLELRCCVVCGGGSHEGMHFSQLKYAQLLNFKIMNTLETFLDTEKAENITANRKAFSTAD